MIFRLSQVPRKGVGALFDWEDKPCLISQLRDSGRAQDAMLRAGKSAMKYLPLAAAVAALLPSLVHAQNPQFMDCRTLEAAGNYVGPDEALVNGLVCKVAKPKANAAVPAASAGKTTESERRMALLGVIEPAILRSKEKAETTPAAPASGTTSEPQSRTNSTASEAPQTPPFEMVHGGGLADVARAYRKNSQTRVAVTPEENVLTPEKPRAERMPPETLPAAAAPAKAIPAPLQHDAKTELPVAAQAPRAEAKPEPVPAAMVSAAEIPARPQPAARTEAVSTPQTPRAAKAGPLLPAVVATPAAASEPSSPPNTEVFGPAQTPRGQQQPEVSPAGAGAAEDAPAPEPQQAVKLGVFVAPQPSASELNSPPQPVSYGTADEDVFNEGQRISCTKNVSLGSLEKEKLILAIPEWAAKWYEKNQKRFPGMCFSDSPMAGAQNYLIVFYTSVPASTEITPLAKISATAETTPVSGMGTFTTSYGSTWHYTYERTVTTTVTTVMTEKVPHNLEPNVLYARAYSEQGIPIAQHWPPAGTKKSKEAAVKKGKNRDASLPEIRTMTELLSQMVEDIAKH